MFLFKTSGATFQSVVANQRHAFRGQPRDWQPGEYVLVSKNRADCASRERQIQFVMQLELIRRLRPGESEQFWPGTEGRWRHLVECRDTKPLHHPFNLKDVLGEEAEEYSAVMTFKRFKMEHERKILEYLTQHELGTEA